jgi:hypothetical protein
MICVRAFKNIFYWSLKRPILNLFIIFIHFIFLFNKRPFDFINDPKFIFKNFEYFKKRNMLFF